MAPLSRGRPLLSFQAACVGVANQLIVIGPAREKPWREVPKVAVIFREPSLVWFSGEAEPWIVPAGVKTSMPMVNVSPWATSD